MTTRVMKTGARAAALLDGALIAVDALRTNRVRAALTIVGIALGVLVVTVMAAVVHGVNAGVTRQIAAAGPTTFFVTTWPAGLTSCAGGAAACPWLRYPPLTVEQVARVAELPDVAQATAEVIDNVDVRSADGDLPNVSVNAYQQGWLDVKGGDVVEGRDFRPREHEAGAAVALLNDKLARRLFGENDAVGHLISVNGVQFQVIGVYRAISNAFDTADNWRLIVPFVTAHRRLHVSLRSLWFTVRPRAGEDRSTATDAVVTALRAARRLRPATGNNFSITTPDGIRAIYDRIVGTFFLVMVVLSAVGLVVGGVGVVAIMLIAVTERTREIGIRKALGATRGSILWQFLVEAVALTGFGTVLGLACGFALVAVMRATTPLDASIPSFAILAAVAASTATGIVFGLYPALRAARLDPVEALRFE